MIWKIAKKEFLLNLMMFKFAVGTIVCVVLTAVFMPVLMSDHQQRLKDYSINPLTVMYSTPGKYRGIAFQLDIIHSKPR